MSNTEDSLIISFYSTLNRKEENKYSAALCFVPMYFDFYLEKSKKYMYGVQTWNISNANERI